MRAVRLKTVLESVADLSGVQYDRQLSPAQRAALIRLVKEHLAAVWEEFPWPDTVRIEERVIGLEWVAGSDRAEGDIVVFEDAYYEAIAAIAAVDDTDDPATATSLWQAATTPFAREIELAAAGETVMGRVFAVYDADPALGRACPVRYALLSDRIQVPPDAPARVWVEFQIAPPALEATPWSADEDASAGAVRYYEAGDFGDCYLAVDDTDETPPPEAAEWEMIPFPAILAAAVKYFASADRLRADGKEDTAMARESKAQDALQRAMSSVNNHQNQAAHWHVRAAA